MPGSRRWGSSAASRWSPISTSARSRTGSKAPPARRQPAAQAAFDQAFADNPLTVPDLGLTAAADAARGRATAARTSAFDLAARATAPLASLGRASERHGSVGETDSDPSADAAAVDRPPQYGAGETEAALGRAGSAAGGAGGALKQAADAGSKAWDSAKDAIERTKELAKGLAEDITGPLKEALKSGELSWQSFAQAVSGIAQNLANRLIDSAFKPIEDALFRAFSGGGGVRWRGSSAGSARRSAGCSAVASPGAAPSARRARSPPLPRRWRRVDRPTVFPFARGIGLMGEAGPEAILPLRRGPRRPARRRSRRRATGTADHPADHQRARSLAGRRLSRHPGRGAGHRQRDPPQPGRLRWLSSGPSPPMARSTEVLEWRTDVLQSQTSEQRLSLRAAPRESPDPAPPARWAGSGAGRGTGPARHGAGLDRAALDDGGTLGHRLCPLRT